MNHWLKGRDAIPNDQPYHVLMVCTGNICRSPMAAGLLRHYLPADLKARIQVSSAGTHALRGHQAHEHAVAEMARLGIDISDHRARQITREIARSADLILVMETAHVGLVKRLLNWGKKGPRLIGEFEQQTDAGEIADPYGQPPQAYAQCIQTLRPCIKGVILWLGTNL
jgi:protein-tyrosine-phosphatase